MADKKLQELTNNITDWSSTTYIFGVEGVGGTPADGYFTAAQFDARFQALDSDLTAIAALSNADGNFIVGTGATWTAESGATARSSLGLVIGTDVQAYDAQLDDFAGLAPTKGRLAVADGSNWIALTVGADTEVLTADSAEASGIKWAAASGGSSLPVADTQTIIKGSADATKLLRFEVDGFTTGTTRVLTPPNADTTIAGLGVAQTFSAVNTFNIDAGLAGTPFQHFEVVKIIRSTGNGNGLSLGYGTRGASDPGVESFGSVRSTGTSNRLALGTSDSSIPQIVISGTSVQLGPANSILSFPSNTVSLTARVAFGSDSISTDAAAAVYQSNGLSGVSVGDLILQARYISGQDKSVGMVTGQTTGTATAKLVAGSTTGVVIKNYTSNSIVPLTIDTSVSTTTNTIDNLLVLNGGSTGTPDAAFGTALAAKLESSTTASQDAGRLSWEWITATHASRASRGDLSSYYTTTERTSISWGSNSSAALLSFFDATLVIKQATTGTTTGFTAGSGTSANDDSTFTGGTGATAYTVGDIVLALKNYGLLAA